ncbi:MAG TPA: FadR/GntR family transcriptional regulator [Azospirillum sp.]|nr:FadR/GntR family transcriptional regulator [Azospirillum sp.]
MLDIAGTYSRRSLHGRVAHDLGARIAGGDYAPGSVLPSEAVLGASFGVSRTVLREAVKVLAAKGLVEARPKVGTRVRPRSDWNMLDPDVLAWQCAVGDLAGLAEDLLEIRRVVEPQAAAMAASRATDAEIRGIAEAFAAMAGAPDAETSVEPDVRFHVAIMEATHNAFLRPLGALIRVALRASFRLSKSSPGAHERSLPDHEAVLDAIRARDDEAARNAMRVLLDRTAEDIRSAKETIR